MDLESSYMGHSLAISELFVPNNTIKGLYMKTWNIPVSGKVVVPTVVVDVTEDTLMYVRVCCCARLSLVCAVQIVFVQTRSDWRFRRTCSRESREATWTCRV